MPKKKLKISAIDLFCGAGGLSLGLKDSGINVVAGVDIDSECQYAFERNIGGKFHLKDVQALTGDWLAKQYPKGHLRLLAGCAPCQPFSSLRRGEDTTIDEKWSLLNEFSRLVREFEPEFVTMENVPGLASKSIFKDFVVDLQACGYHVTWRSVHCPKYGMAQQRRRLVLLASKFSAVELIPPTHAPDQFVSVRAAIYGLPPLEAGQVDEKDTLHRARSLSPINLERIKAARPGGTWKDWPDTLKLSCHAKASGESFKSVYARMTWDDPSPTITTQAYNFGTGRFGHPDQDRPISLREAAILQSFPTSYEFTAPGAPVHFSTIGRLIGNAVPPRLGQVIGASLIAALPR